MLSYLQVLTSSTVTRLTLSTGQAQLVKLIKEYRRQPSFRVDLTFSSFMISAARKKTWQLNRNILCFISPVIMDKCISPSLLLTVSKISWKIEICRTISATLDSFLIFTSSLLRFRHTWSKIKRSMLLNK